MPFMNAGTESGTVAPQCGIAAVARCWGRLHLCTSLLVEQVAESWRGRDNSVDSRPSIHELVDSMFMVLLYSQGKEGGGTRQTLRWK
jgi:hypothetical protein